MQAENKGPEDVSIHIDKKLYRVPAGSLTGAEIRGLLNPPLASTYDLYLEVPSEDDRLIADGDSVNLKSGLHFFSAPGNITPGR